MQKLHLMRMQKSGPQKMPKIRMKNSIKQQSLGKINRENPEFHRN